MLKKLSSKKGFTLVEILVVILIIGILFVAFLPRIDFAGDKARETNVKTDMRTFMVAAEQLFKENSGLPNRAQSATGNGVEADTDKNFTQINLLLDPSLKLAGPTADQQTAGYQTAGLVSALEDPWGENYRVDLYSNYPTTNKQAILITSHGKEYELNNTTADYGALIIYDKGHVSSCTFGLNQNIGTLVGITPVDGEYTVPDAGNSAAFITAAQCNN